MFIHTFTKVIYGIFGAAFLIIGSALVTFKLGILTTPLLNAVDGSLKSLHLVQEYGCMFIFAGLMSFWAIRNYRQSVGYHWALTAFWFFMATVHWFDVRGMRSLTGPLINTIPVTLFLITGFMRQRAATN